MKKIIVALGASLLAAAPFVGFARALPTITITAPASGSSLVQGTIVRVAWTSTNTPFGAYVYLTIDDTGYGVHRASYDRSYNWSIPTGFPLGAHTMTTALCTSISCATVLVTNQISFTVTGISSPPPPPAPCAAPWGTSVPSGQSVIAYQTSSVASGQQCVSQTRLCTNGALSGSYQNQNCTVQTTACTPDATSPQIRTSTLCPTGQTGTITETRTSSCASGASSPSWSAWTVTSNTCAVATQSSTLAANPTCTLNANPSVITAGKSTTLTWSSVNTTGGVISRGIGSVSPNGSRVVPVSTTTIYRGTFTGTNGVAITCIPATVRIVATQAGANCYFSDTFIADGISVTAYQSPSPANGQCVSQQRSCTSGTLSGAYQYDHCSMATTTAPCTLDGVTKNSGDAYKFYFARSATSCALAKTRRCDNGTWTGNSRYRYASCTVIPTATSTPRYMVGDRVRANATHRVFLQPFLFTRLLGWQATSSLGTVIGGRATADGHTRWYVGWDSGQVGWSAQVHLHKTIAITDPGAQMTATTRLLSQAQTKAKKAYTDANNAVSLAKNLKVNPGTLSGAVPAMKSEIAAAKRAAAAAVDKAQKAVAAAQSANTDLASATQFANRGQSAAAEAAAKKAMGEAIQSIRLSTAASRLAGIVNHVIRSLSNPLWVR